jgi:hypothetical protein
MDTAAQNPPIPAKSHQRSAISRQQLVILLVLNLLLIAGLAAFNASVLVPARGLRFDFYPHWVGGRAVWSGQTPYTPEITRQVQQGMFGAELPPEADQQNMAYPAYAAVVLAPVIALPAPTSIAVWMAVGLLAVIWTPIIWLAILGWRPSPMLLFVMILGFTFVLHYAMDMLVLAQFSGWVLLTFSLGVWLLTQKRDIAAGMIFALGTVPPTVGGALAIIMLGACALRGRWRGFVAFGVTMAILVGISMLLIGWWIPDWLRVVREYAAYAAPVWPPNFLQPIARYGLVCAAVVFFGMALVRFLRTRSKEVEQEKRNMVDLAVAALLIGLMLLPQTGYYYLVLLIPVIVATLYRARELPPNQRRLIWLSCALAVVSPWFYFSIPDFNPDMQSLILPLHVGVTWVAAQRETWERGGWLLRTSE